MGFALVFPFLPLYVDELGVRTGGSVEFWSGMAYSSQAVAMLVMAPIWGMLADRFGRKMMIQRALFGGAVVLAAMGFARSAEELVLLRAIQGTVTGVIPSSSALVAATVPRDRAGQALGLMQSSVWIGTALGPLAGGVLGDEFGFRSAFTVTGVVLLLSGIAVWRWASEEGAEVESDLPALSRRTFVRELRRSWGRVLASPGVRGVYSVKFTVRFASTAVLPVAPLLVVALAPLQSNVATLAGVFTSVTSVAGILAALFFGRLGDRVGHRQVLVFGCVASAAAYAAFNWVDSIAVMMFLAVAIGVASGAVMPGIGALLAQTAPPGGQGLVYGIDASVNAAARSVAPLAGSAVAAAVSFKSAFVFAGFVYLAAGGLAAVGQARSRRGEGADGGPGG